VIVVDASVLANVVADDGADGRVARDHVAAAAAASIPDLADVETVAVLRKRWLAGTLPVNRFARAIDDLAALPLQRFPTIDLMPRAFELRANLTVYDATSIALAEALDCELVTADARLSRAPGLRCPVRVIPQTGAP
jgi:predicted nucleic acid-binding protein